MEPICMSNYDKWLHNNVNTRGRCANVLWMVWDPVCQHEESNGRYCLQDAVLCVSSAGGMKKRFGTRLSSFSSFWCLPKNPCFYLCVCERDGSKSHACIFRISFVGTGLGQRVKWFNFERDPGQDVDARIFFFSYFEGFFTMFRWGALVLAEVWRSTL